MDYKKLGRTNLEVSVIGLGGEWFIDKPLEHVADIVGHAMDNGVNYIDIFMPQPETRKAIGEALVGRREKMLIQGHLCTTMQDGQYERTRDLAKTKASFEELLSDLKTDYIDVGMIHYVDTFEDYEVIFGGEIIEYAKELKAKGVIKHLGVSSHNPLVALKMIETGLIDVLMFSINPAYDLEDEKADVNELLEYKGLNETEWVVNATRQKLYSECERLGVGITVMKALGAGSLLKAESSPFKVAMSVAQCCHYCLTRPAVTSVLIGCNTKEELTHALGYTTCSDEERDYSTILSSADKIKMTGKCMYCNHCLPCPMNIDVATVTKFLDIARDNNEVPPTVMSHYHSLSANASDCIECGNCESNCPFAVKIIENMRQAKEIFGTK